MTLQYASDLHLEFNENNVFLKANPLQPAGDILILAGDIVPFSLLNKHADFFRYVSGNFETVYWLPGNHEYYGSDISTRSGVLHEKIKSNVFLVNNISVQQGNLRFLFSTLWSHISPANEWHIERSVSDFRAIRYKNYRFSAEPFNALHQQALYFITTETAKDVKGKTIVVTHHVPTLMHYPPLYRGSSINEAFAVELSPFIEQSNISYWIYGHHHSNTPAFTIGHTTLLTNQLGYIQRGEHHLFDTGKTISL